MNKIILIITSVLILGIAMILAFTTFFKSPDVPILANTSQLYTRQYSNVIYPNAILTPGDIATNDLNVICYEYYSKLLVAVPDETVKQVYEEYMIDNPGYKKYEIDHWIPLALGGSNNLQNLWPQPINYPGYKEKDYTHMYLRDQVCNHNMSLSKARELITGDWYTIYLNIKN